MEFHTTMYQKGFILHLNSLVHKRNGVIKHVSCRHAFCNQNAQKIEMQLAIWSLEILLMFSYCFQSCGHLIQGVW